MSEVVTPATSSAPSVSSVDMGSFSVSSNAESSESMREVLDADSDISKAAARLGEKGGRAAAEARRTIKPIPDKPKSEAARVAESAEATTATEEKPLGKPRDDPRARMLEATREAAELKRALAAKDAELAEARRERAAREQARTVPEAKPKAGSTYKEDPSVRPSSEHYTEWDEYNADLVAWTTNKTLETYAQRQSEARREAMVNQVREEQHAAVEASFRNYSEKVTAAWPSAEAFNAEINPDLISWVTSEEGRNNGEQIGPTHVIADEIVALDDPAPVMRYLSKNPEELQRIAALTSARQIQRAMAKIEDRAGAAPTASAPKPEVSRAPKPVRQVAGALHATDSDDDLSDLANQGHDPAKFDEYVRRRSAAKR